MALQCTPENIQQMMLALKASFGLVENERKQVNAHSQCYGSSMHDTWQMQATAFLQIQQQQPGFSQILLAVISQARLLHVVLPPLLSLSPQAGQSAPDIASSASISLKNLCKKHWTNDDSTDFVVCDADKQFLKASMLAGEQSCH